MWPGPWEIVIILVIVLVLFGGKKLPELARGLGKGLREFKNASRDIKQEVNNVVDDVDETSLPFLSRFLEVAVSFNPVMSTSLSAGGANVKPPL